MGGVADRTVVAKLVLDIAGYSPAATEASKSTSALAAAQKEAEASAKAAGIAARDAGFAARDAAAQASAAAAAQSAASKEAAAAAKEASAAQVTAAMATTDAERVEAEAAAQAAAERAAQAKEALTQATAQAEATAEVAAAAKAGSLEAAKYAASQRDVAAAAKEAAAADAATAKETEAAAAQRTKAYKESGTALSTMALGTGAAIGLMVKSAGDFQSSTQHLVTDAGESQDKLAMVQAGILKTATATGTSATQLVDAMYHIESAGFHGQAGLDVLTTAAEGAKVGAADLGTVAKTLTGTMNSYSTAGYSSVQMMNMLIATTAAGDLKMNDLAASLGNVAPQAAAAHIKFSEVGGAIATMTSQNMTADRATQDLANTIGNLENPSNVAITQMQQLGLNSNDVSQNLGEHGLTGTLEMLTTAVLQHTQDGQVFIDTLKQSQNAAADANTMLAQLPASIQGISKELLNGSITAAEYKKDISGLDAPQQHMAAQFEQLVKSSGSFNDLLKKGGPTAETYTAAMAKMLGGSTGLNTALLLTGARMQTFKDNATAIQDAANKGGNEVDNWSKIQGTFNQKLDVAKASLGAMGIAIGTTALPMVSELAKWVTDIVTPITEWVDKNKGLTEGILGTAAAAAGLVLAIKAIAATQSLLTKAFEGINTAIVYFTKNSEVAATKAEAMGAANAAAAAETEAAAVSTGGWARNLGSAIPVIGSVVAGVAMLGDWLSHVGQKSVDAAAAMNGMTNQLLDLAAGTKSTGVDIAGMASLAMKAGGDLQSGLLDPLDKGLANLVASGHVDQASKALADIDAKLTASGQSADKFNSKLKAYNDALGSVATTQREAALGTDGATKAVDGNTAALGANASAASAAADATGALADATGTAATSADAESATTKAVTLQLFQAAAASRSLTEAQAAEASNTNDAAAAHGNAKDAVTKHATATKDATAAAKDHTAATAKDATAAKDAAKAATDQSKAAADSAKADAAAAAAANSKAAADAAGGSSAKLNAQAKKDAAAATRDATTADKADATAANASSTAHDAASRAVDAHTKAVDAQAKAAADAAKAAGGDQAAQDAAAESAREAAEVHETGTKWLLAVADAEKNASGNAQDLDQSVKDEVGAMKDAQTAASNLKDGMDALNGVHISASKAAIDFQQKIADLTKALHDNGTTLDITTDAGRKNLTAIDDLASAAAAHAQSVTDETGSIKAGNDALDASRAQFDAVLKSAGLSTQQIDAFNKSILQTPKLDAVTLQVNADTSNAAAALQSLEQKYGGTGITFGGGPSGKRIVAGYSTGGLVTGSGTGTSDSNMVAVSNKEYIVNAAAVARPGVLAALNALNFGTGNATVVKPQLPTYQLPAPVASSGAGSGSALHIENYFENGAPPQQIAAELGFLARARGSSW